MENPVKMDDLGLQLFSETSIYIYILHSKHFHIFQHLWTNPPIQNGKVWFFDGALIGRKILPKVKAIQGFVTVNFGAEPNVILFFLPKIRVALKNGYTLPDIQFLLQKKRLPQPLAISTVFVVVLFGDLECGCENRMRFREMTKDLWKSSPVDRRSCWGYEVFVSCQKVVEINPKTAKIHLEIAQKPNKEWFLR